MLEITLRAFDLAVALEYPRSSLTTLAIEQVVQSSERRTTLAHGLARLSSFEKVVRLGVSATHRKRAGYAFSVALERRELAEFAKIAPYIKQAWRNHQASKGRLNSIVDHGWPSMTAATASDV